MRDWEEKYKEESSKVIQERSNYAKINNRLGVNIFEKLSIIFLGFGFISLLMIPFTEMTLIQSACIFIISHVLSPNDTNRYESVIKGVVEDVANIRIATTILSKEIQKKD